MKTKKTFIKTKMDKANELIQNSRHNEISIAVVRANLEEENDRLLKEVQEVENTALELNKIADDLMNQVRCNTKMVENLKVVLEGVA